MFLLNNSPKILFDKINTASLKNRPEVIVYSLFLHSLFMIQILQILCSVNVLIFYRSPSTIRSVIVKIAQLLLSSYVIIYFFLFVTSELLSGPYVSGTHMP